MLSQGHSIDNDAIEISAKNKNRAKAMRVWLRCLLYGALTTLACLFLTFAINQDPNASSLVLPLGIVISGFIGTLVFVIGTMITPPR